jgi:hypothetical protein
MNQEGKGFRSIHFILENNNQNIWLGGKEGLWRFDGESVIDMKLRIT